MADYFFVGLDFVRRSFIDAGVPDERIFLVPYGVDTSGSFRPVDRTRRDSFNILFVGQVSWYKGLHLFLDAFEQLEIPNATLTILGIVHAEWRPYFEKRIAASSKSISYRATVPREQMPQNFADADVFVFPSLGGGIGLATYEAMASGLPVITSDGDVVIRDGVDGLVVPAEDTQGWIEGLSRLYEDRTFGARLGASAAERVGEFSWEAYRQGVRDAYREIGRREGIA
jgi:glycosyltransferase involved in cell wall biosynthesis